MRCKNLILDSRRHISTILLYFYYKFFPPKKVSLRKSINLFWKVCFLERGQLQQIFDISFPLIGSERNYVILSLVRSLPLREIEEKPLRSWMSEHLGFVADEHQINVALTRAKHGLCIVGKSWEIYSLF